MSLSENTLPGALQRLPGLVEKEKDDLLKIEKLPNSLPKFAELVDVLRKALEKLPSSPKLIDKWCKCLAVPLGSYIEYFPYFEEDSQLRLRKSPLLFIEEVHEIISLSESLLLADMGVLAFSKLLKASKSMLRYHASQQNLDNFDFSHTCCFISGKPVSATLDTADIVGMATFNATIIKRSNCKNIRDAELFLLEHKRVVSVALCATGPKRQRIMLYPSFRAHEFEFHYAKSENTLVLRSDHGNIELKGKAAVVAEWAEIFDGLFNQVLPENDTTAHGLGISFSSSNVRLQQNTSILRSGDSDSECEPKQRQNKYTVQDCVDLGLPLTLGYDYANLVARVSPAVPESSAQPSYNGQKRAAPPMLALPSLPVKSKSKPVDLDSPGATSVSSSGSFSKPQSKTLLEAVERRRKIEQNLMAREKQGPYTAITQVFGEHNGLSSVSLDSDIRVMTGSTGGSSLPITPDRTRFDVGDSGANTTASQFSPSLLGLNIGASLKKTLSFHTPTNNSNIGFQNPPSPSKKGGRALKDLFRRKHELSPDSPDMNELALFRGTGSDIASQASLPYMWRQTTKNNNSKTSLELPPTPPRLELSFNHQSTRDREKASHRVAAKQETSTEPAEQPTVPSSSSSSVRRPLFNIYRSTSSNNNLSDATAPKSNSGNAIALCESSNNSTIAMSASFGSSNSLEEITRSLNSDLSFDSIETATDTLRTISTTSTSLDSIRDCSTDRKAGAQLLTLDLSANSIADLAHSSVSTLTANAPAFNGVSQPQAQKESKAEEPAKNQLQLPAKVLRWPAGSKPSALSSKAESQSKSQGQQTIAKPKVNRPGQLNLATHSMPSILSKPSSIQPLLAPPSASTSRVSFADDTEMILFSAPMWVSKWCGTKWVPLSLKELGVEVKVNQAGSRLDINGDGISETLRLDDNSDVKKLGVHDIEVRVKKDIYILRSARQEIAGRVYNAVRSLKVDLSDPASYTSLRLPGKESSASSSIGSNRSRILTPPILNKRQAIS